MKVLFGLGNPGPEYRRTRHNIGFRVVSHLAKKERILLKNGAALQVVWGKGRLSEKEVRLGLPQSFMNRSGEVIRRCQRRWGFSIPDMLVVVDDLQLPLGQLRIRSRGSDGGQKGLRSIIEALGTDAFARVRCGIGRKEIPSSWEAFVLQPFDRQEKQVVEEMVEKGSVCCRLWAEEGLEACMNHFNQRGNT